MSRILDNPTDRILAGNDIVDLCDPDALDPATLASNSPFRARVFTARENRHIDRSENPARALWSLWALKEAGYKALRRIQPELPFAWQKFSVEIRDKGEARVTHNKDILQGEIILNADYVHALTFSPAARAAVRHHAVQKIPSTTNADSGPAIREESRLIREFALDVASERLALPRAALWVTPPSSKPDRPPDLYHKSDANDEPVLAARGFSLSHHGRFFAALIIP